MPRHSRKSPDELMQEAIWTRKDLCRVFRIDPRTLNKYLYHPDVKKRLPCYKIGNTVMIERQKALRFFKYEPFRTAL